MEMIYSGLTCFAGVVAMRLGLYFMDRGEGQ